MPALAAPPLSLSGDDRRVLVKMARSARSAHRVVVQAKALLWAADGESNEKIARRCGVDADTVRRWRRRFEERGVDGVGVIAKGRGRKPWLPDGTVEEIVRVTLEEAPTGTSTRWTTRSLARRMGVGKDTVARIWRERAIEPWKAGTIDLCGDPRLEAALVDVVGLYLDPPRLVAAFSFDESTRTAASNCTRPSHPIEHDRDGTVTHEHVHPGPRRLFAASSVAAGEAYPRRGSSRARGVVLTFFDLVDAHVPRGLEVRVVLGDMSAHVAPEVTRWLDHPRRARWHLHFTPTSSSWTTLVERWFEELGERPSRPGAFTSVGEVVKAVEQWSERRDDHREPFVWHKAGQEIVEKVGRSWTAPPEIRSGADH